MCTTSAWLYIHCLNSSLEWTLGCSQLLLQMIYNKHNDCCLYVLLDIDFSIMRLSPLLNCWVQKLKKHLFVVWHYVHDVCVGVHAYVSVCVCVYHCMQAALHMRKSEDNFVAFLLSLHALCASNPGCQYCRVSPEKTANRKSLLAGSTKPFSGWAQEPCLGLTCFS